jgi:hypothetical protein
MRAADLLTAGILMLVGGVVIYDSVQLGSGWGSDGPKSGFFPFWLGVVMIVACAGIIVQTVRRDSGQVFVTREQLARVAKVLWPAAAMVLLTTWLGLYVAAACYLGFYMRWVGRHSWRAVVLVSVLVPVVTFVIFEIWFLVPMPKGPLEAWLGY